MKVIVSSGKRLERKVTLDIPDELFSRIEELAEKYGFRTEEALKILLTGDFLEDTEGISDEKLEELEKEMERLEGRLYELEGKWSPLKFRTYYLAMDNQNLSIQLSAMIAQNKRLRERLGLPERDYERVIKKIHYYLNFSKPGDSSEEPSP
ncbi:hypothetical protein A3L11_08905 [Thermococcus siculi]|uniref:Uncharacterized protein n=1 Tax=Thermococcus siculi TaxID=72803 RepID=A0A2Z2MPM0_9EURY|nr:hypothetical protein [Thermococcus siculi]ASJ09341.1 hypothetical protein A3L11_08905 [Thermococcus siculi]